MALGLFEHRFSAVVRRAPPYFFTDSHFISAALSLGGQEQVPHQRLERFGMRSNGLRIHNPDQNAHIRDLRGEAPVATDDATHSRSHLFGTLQCPHQIGADVTLRISSSNREDEDQILRVDMASAQRAIHSRKCSARSARMSAANCM